MARSLLLVTAFALLLTACNKADDTTSPEDMLRNGQWKRTSLKASHRNPLTGNMDITDGFSLIDECIKDNTLEFKTNYKGVEHKNNKCNAGDADLTDFTWEIYNSGKNIRIYNANETFGGEDINAEIINQSETQISMRYLLIEQDPSQSTPTDTTIVTDVFRR